MSIAGLMTHRVLHERSTTTFTDGKAAKTFATVTESQRCLIQEKSGGLVAAVAGHGVQYDAVGYFPVDADLKPQGGDDTADRITIIEPTRLAGVSFLVKLVTDDAGRGHHLKALLVRLPSAGA